MIHQPPAGARDLLPLEVAQKAWINDRIQKIFYGWGYQRIVTSTLEWLETLKAGGAIDLSTVIQIQDDFGSTMGLRPELTVSIARTAAMRMKDNNYPQRLCYRANIFRNPGSGHHGKQIEFYQAGVELLFAGGVLADAEILLLVADCLEQLGVPQWHLILGEAGLTKSLLAVFPEMLRRHIRYCLANLDYTLLENLPYPSKALKERARLLFDLRGEPLEVLQKLPYEDLDSSGRQMVDNLKYLIAVLNQERSLPIILDLSLIQNFDFYTGVIFKILSSTDNHLRILGQGGRYDELLGLYHPQGKQAPGIGFSLNIEDLHLCLLSSPDSQMPRETPPLDWLVIPQTPEAAGAAFNYAQNLRSQEGNLRIVLDLGDRSLEEIREYALNNRIRGLVWIKDDDTYSVEYLVDTPQV